MLRRIAAAAALLLAAACAQPPVSEDVTVSFEKNDRVLITEQTTFNDADVKSEARLAMLESARFAAAHDTDAWAARFGRVNAEDEEVTTRKHHGELDRVSRSVRIPINQLQTVFSDVNISVNVLNGDGWRELSFIPGGSVRASRDQRRHFDDALLVWSGAVSRYFAAIDRLYTYLDLNPYRAQPLFSALLNEQPEDSAVQLVADEEQPLVDSVRLAMEEIANLMDKEQDGGGATFAEEADLIYNAFPARMSIRVPGDVISKEGFDEKLVIEPVSLFDAIEALDGKWISPDPLATLLRDEQPSPDALARTERRSAKVVQPAEIANAIREQLARPKMYVVRWRS